MLVDEPPGPAARRRVQARPPPRPPDVRMLIGYCTFGSPDAALLVSLFPRSSSPRREAADYPHSARKRRIPRAASRA